MTSKQIPKQLYALIEEYVVPGGMEGQHPMVPGVTSPFSAGVPDAVSWDEATGESVWLWAADFTPEQEAEWTLILRTARMKRDGPDLAEAEPHIAVLRAWQNRGGAPTDAQRDTVLDAMTQLFKLLLKD